MIRKIVRFLLTVILCVAIAGTLYFVMTRYFHENAVLKQVISRLEADSRIAEVLVTATKFDEGTQQAYTTIKFVEYDTSGNPLTPRYFTFSGNIIQFQSLVIRFDDLYVRRGDFLRGKSAYLFWKVFMLDGKHTQEYTITHLNQIPNGYRIAEKPDAFEQELWRRFWQYALDPEAAHRMGVKNAQIEAPGMLFVPGYLYTIRIEHDGGMRIDAQPLPSIVRGEYIPR